jgi:alkyl sulfatase BDS1-like metallo-beta-lactamase superfamily hydrolase
MIGRSILISAAIPVLAVGYLAATVTAAPAQEHFDPKGKPPSAYTVKMFEELRQSLPFNDRRDFEENERGFIAAPPYKQIMA